MSKPKVWTLPALLDRIWAAVPISRKTIVHDSGGVPHRVVTAFDEEYKDRTYHLNKIGAPVAAALYERIKTMRAKGSGAVSAVEESTGYREPLASQLRAWQEGFEKGMAAAGARKAGACNCPTAEQFAAQGYGLPGEWACKDCPVHGWQGPV